MIETNKLLKTQGYWITFAAYALIHSLRMCYSFNKVNLKRSFQIGEFYLGLLDTFLYLSYGIGVFIRYEVFEGNYNAKKLFFITSMLISCCFGAIGYFGIFEEENVVGFKIGKILITLGVIGYGFFHLAVYQICGSIVSGYYHPEKESHKLGFWGASTSVGNVLGFLVSNLIIHQLQLKWEVSLFLFSILNLLMAYLFYFWIEVPEEDESYKQELYQITENRTMKEESEEIRSIHWFNFIKKTISTSEEARYTYAAYIITKATVYTFLMWFPIFLVSKNLESVSGYISTLFDIGGTLGGYMIGKLHKIHYHSEEENNVKPIEANNGKYEASYFGDIFLKYRNVFFVLCITFLILAFLLVDASLVVYCPLTLLMGFLLGGTYNNISSHEIFKIAKGKVLLTDMLLNLSVGISTVMIGLVQLLTAFLLKWNVKDTPRQEQSNYSVVFIVLLILMVLCIIVMIKRVFVVENEQNKINSKVEVEEFEVNNWENF